LDRLRDTGTLDNQVTEPSALFGVNLKTGWGLLKLAHLGQIGDLLQEIRSKGTANTAILHLDDLFLFLGKFVVFDQRGINLGSRQLRLSLGPSGRWRM
jgi:hypothetical protein